MTTKQITISDDSSVNNLLEFSDSGSEFEYAQQYGGDNNNDNDNNQPKFPGREISQSRDFDGQETTTDEEDGDANTDDANTDDAITDEDAVEKSELAKNEDTPTPSTADPSEMGTASLCAEGDIFTIMNEHFMTRAEDGDDEDGENVAQVLKNIEYALANMTATIESKMDALIKSIENTFAE